jgi:hypothetical protein
MEIVGLVLGVSERQGKNGVTYKSVNVEGLTVTIRDGKLPERKEEVRLVDVQVRDARGASGTFKVFEAETWEPA